MQQWSSLSWFQGCSVVLLVPCEQDHSTTWYWSSPPPLIKEMVCSSTVEIPTQPITPMNIKTLLSGSVLAIITATSILGITPAAWAADGCGRWMHWSGYQQSFVVCSRGGSSILSVQGDKAQHAADLFVASELTLLLFQTMSMSITSPKWVVALVF